MLDCVPLIAKAIRDHGETIVLRMVYQGRDGVRKRRFVSPYLFTSSNDSEFMAICLTKGLLRQFKVNRCSEMEEYPSYVVSLNPLDGLMPMEIIE